MNANSKASANPDLTRFAWLSIAAAVATILLKGFAWWMSGSVGLLSDALESGVNLAGAIMTLAMLALAAQPPDEEHAFGHGKAEYFASAFEGFLILIAAALIAVASVKRLFSPQELTQVGPAILVSILAALINYAVARILFKVGRKHHSIALEADAHHLLTDVWTSCGVIVAIAAVWLTNWFWLDPAIALLVACNIVWTGWRLLARSAAGLMDSALPQEQHAKLTAILERYRERGASYHALRTKQSGSGGLVSVHVLVPGQWSVRRGHDLLHEIEADIHAELPHLEIITHLEPVEDPASYEGT
ncbi:MAG: cation diffusion facilitator family transporter [Betaproteobacteria bacterium]|nr:cation diffusion facilitator family transporter [Betaproteobacteria bacterium]